MNEELTLEQDEYATQKVMESARADRIRRAAQHLLNLSGASYIREGRHQLELTSLDPSLATDDEVEWLNALLARYEREANLRGENWTWEETL